MNPPPQHTANLLEISRSCPPLMRALEAARSLRLSSWCIGAGAVRNRVWDHLHGYPQAEALDEVDLVYFDGSVSLEHESELQHALSRVLPEVRWDVVNQAHVHRWYERAFGTQVEPLPSLEAGIATWPEFATCVGLSLQDDGSLDVIAPFGLHDLFNLQVRHNAARASAEAFTRRHESKRWRELWPALNICAPFENAA